VKLPNIRRLKIDTLANRNLSFKDFLEHCIPNCLEFLILNLNNGETIESDYYFPSLEKALIGVSKELYFYDFKLSYDAFEKIVKASYKCERLVFNYWMYDAEAELDFSGPKYLTNFISFYHCNHSHNSWGTKSYRFENIVKGIKNCELKNSLTQIDVYYCQIGKSKAQEILNKHGLNGITAVEQENTKNPMT
jgi:hypothetical protein